MFQPSLGLDAIRTEIVNQQVIVSNTVPLDKPLATALRASLLQIDRTTPTNVLNDAKALQNIASKLNKTSLSNTFDSLLRTAANNYANVAISAFGSYSNRLATTFPSGVHTAGNRLIEQALAALDAGLDNIDSALISKAINVALKKLTIVGKTVVKAENAPAPRNNFSATVSASNEGTFQFKPIIQSVVAGYNTGTKGLLITATDLKLSGGLNGVIQTRTIIITANVPADGTYTYDLTGLSNASAFYEIGRVQGGELLFGEVYNATDSDVDSDSGTLTLTFNSAQRLVYGTFQFSANGSTEESRTATVSGSFSINYVQ